MKVAAKDFMNVGDRICLPISVKALPFEKQQDHYSEKEVNFIRGLELYKVLKFDSVGLKLFLSFTFVAKV